MKIIRAERLDKEKVLMTAAELADRDGLERLSLTTLATALGIRTPSLYTHIASLGELQRLIGLHGLGELNARIARAALGKSSEDAVQAFAVAYRKYVHEHPGVYAATLPTAPERGLEWEEAKEKIMETIGLVLKGFGLEGDEEIHVVRAMRSLVHGFATLEMSGSFKNPVDRDESFDRALSIFLAGLKRSGKA
jgi:AcrR family transcriptional regulator